MPINKMYASARDAVADIPDGASVMIDGFGGPGGRPAYLISALRDHGAKNLTVICNAVGLGGFGARQGQPHIDPGVLVANKQVKKVIASFPVGASSASPTAFEMAYKRGEVELELVPQGTLAERIRAGGAGVPAFYTPTGAGTLIEKGKEKRVFDGKECLLEYALKADYALLRAYKADKMGNLIYRGISRTFNPIMAMASGTSIVEVDEIVEVGEIDSEAIVTPGIFIKRIVKRPVDLR